MIKMITAGLSATAASVLLVLTVGPVSSAAAAPTAMAATVVCDANVLDPHYSRGAGSVIFKTRITCRGDAPPVQFRLQGSLGSVSGGVPGQAAEGPPLTRVTSDDTQTVPMGGTVTFYTPLVGGPAVRGSASTGAWWQRSPSNTPASISMRNSPRGPGNRPLNRTSN